MKETVLEEVTLEKIDSQDKLTISCYFFVRKVSYLFYT